MDHTVVEAHDPARRLERLVQASYFLINVVCEAVAPLLPHPRQEASVRIILLAGTR